MTKSTRAQSRKARKLPKNPAKKSSILRAAEKVFARNGFHEATVADIAKEAGVSEATIYDYFPSKEELLFSIPAEKTSEHLEGNREILQYVRGAADKLRVLISRHIMLYALNPDYANVVLILKSNRKFLKTDAYKIVQEAARITLEVLDEGIKSGEFRRDLQPHLVRAMIWGTIEHLVVRKSVMGKPVDLLSLADEITLTIFQGILSREKDPSLRVHVTVDHRTNP